MDAQLIRAGFDTLEYAVPAVYPLELFACLEVAKEEAVKSKKAYPAIFNNQRFLVHPGGGQGGYTYLLNTGPFGAIIKIKDARSNDQWSTHAKLSAHGLASKGVSQMREETNAFLRSIGARFNHENTRISRADYAMDYFAPNLAIDIEQIVAHPRTTKTQLIDVTSTGEENSYFRIGKMPGRQVCIYDKTKAISQKRDLIWQDILSKSAHSHGLESSYKGIWRIECRAGRDAIDKFSNPRLFDRVLPQANSLFLESMRAIQWKQPTADSNRSRWPLHPIWKTSKAHVENEFEAFSPVPVSDATRNQIIQERIAGLEAQSEGLFLTLAAIHGVRADQVFEFVKEHFSKIGNRLGARDDIADQLATRNARHMILTNQV